ncbi:MAG: carboxylesterase family protein, partial [Myxococcales bacterium]|nr:carboxylesterase family protein [Myxococcales bacterium]
EDCLTLNVWTPAEPPMEPLPVMVWLHGGGNVSGSSSFTIYDGRPISEQGRVVFVSVNYRLGAFGFMAHAALSAESPEGASGNYGLLDQIAALRWVQRNAAAFGGDPDTVTLLGESAGGTDTCMLLTSPLAAGLFHRAIVESGSCRTAPLAAREAQGAQLAALMGCDGTPDAAACMRGRTDLEVLAAQEGILNGSIAGFGPAVDGYVLPQDPREVFAAGAQQPVPVIMGANENEMELLLPFTFDHGRAAYEAFVAETYRDESPETIAEILARYPYTDTWNFRDAASAVTTDTSFLCPLRRNLRALVATHPEAVYRYHFTRVLDTPILRDLKAFHGLEVMFALDTLGQIPLPYTRNNPTNDALITAMVGYWSRFAHTGDPNGPGAVPWPTYEPVTDRYLELGDAVISGEGVHADDCDFWDSLE